MSLRDTFHTAAATAFTVFASLVKSGMYTHVVDDGFSRTETEVPVNIIISSFDQTDIQKVSFAALIQPTDIQGLIKGSDLTLPLSSEGKMTVDSIEYGVVAHQTDPAEALYIVLLRKN